MSITYPCGCVNDFDRGVLKSILKCDHHKSMQREIGELGEEYYQELGSSTGTPPHVAEFEECFGKCEPVDRDRPFALEIGAGASHYVPMITDAGWFYCACEPSRWARKWMLERYGDRQIQLSNRAWEHYDHNDCVLGDRGGSGSQWWQYGMILAAHSLEHMVDAPAALEKMAEYLAPGGVLYIIVPDDSDPVNPDHLWFFNTATLDLSIRRAGLVVEVLVTRQRVEHEKFIYCKARKPDLGTHRPEGV